MNTDLVKLTTAAQDNLLGLMRMSQATVVETVKTVADSLSRVTPSLPASAKPLTKLVPTPEQRIELTYGFAEKFVRNQREFAEALFEAVRPERRLSSVA